MEWLGTYGLALGATIVIETGLVRLLARRHWPRLRVDVPLLNLVTHPLLTWALWSGTLALVPGELLVLAVEALGYAALTGLPWRQATVLSGVLNAATWGLGMLVIGLGG